MGTNILTQEIKREFARVAAAFSVEQWTIWTWEFPEYWKRGYTPQRHYVQVEFEDNSPIWRSFVIGPYDENDECFVDESQVWLNGMVIPADDALFNTLMARGLYRLGIEDEAILSQLSPLSVHEKLELRHSMPREFWPKTCLDEENAP